MKSKIITARSLVDSGHKPMSPRDALRQEVFRRIDYFREQGLGDEQVLQGLFPNTILDSEALESLVATLLSGNNVLFFGPPGSGKTNLAKDIWRLIPKKLYAVDGCPVQDDPFSFLDADFAKEVPGCPLCKSRFSGVAQDELADFDHSAIDPINIPVRPITLREGFGLARVQGSPEVFPDTLTGTLNLHKLEMLGDPTSPEVFQPGKMLQAHRGLLLIDEIGKLPRGTQNVLLQALQEGIVTPARSRSTFPAAFVAVTNSNIDDLDNINEPLNDRLTNIFVGYNSQHHKNRQIIDQVLKAPPLFVPDIFVEAAIYLVEDWRNNRSVAGELSEVGSNRAMMDVVRRSISYAQLRSRNSVTLEDFRLGSKDALFGRIRAKSGDSYLQNHRIISEFITKRLPQSLETAATSYWCRFYVYKLGEDKPEGQRTLKELNSILDRRDQVPGSIKEGGPNKKFRRYARYILERERPLGLAKAEVVEKVLDIQTGLGIFDGESKFDLLRRGSGGAC